MKARVLTALVLLTGCRSLVLEDRSSCPALVYFEMVNGCPVEAREKVDVSVWDCSSLEELAGDSPRLAEMCGKDYYLSIQKRREIAACGISGLQGGILKGTKLELPLGSEGDPIFRFCLKEALIGESVKVPVRMTREHSRITVHFRSDDGEFPHKVRVRGNTCGLDIVSGEPLPGNFSFFPQQTSPGVFFFTVPRQADLSLTVELLSEDGSQHEDDIVLWDALCTIEGFSWSMESLPDLTVEIDYVNASVTAQARDRYLTSTTNYLL